MMDCLLFGAEAYLDLLAYMNSTDNEICGIGRIQQDQGGVAYVSEIKILRQEVGAADVFVDEEALNEFFHPMKDEERKQWCFNWHTHPTFATNPSGTDRTNYTKMQSMFDTFVAYIINKKQEFYCGLYTSYPFNAQVDMNRIWIQEFKRHFNKRPFTIPADMQGQFISYLLATAGYRMTRERQDYIQEQVDQLVTERPRYGNFTPQYPGQYQGHYTRTPVYTVASPQSQLTGAISVATQKTDAPATPPASESTGIMTQKSDSAALANAWKNNVTVPTTTETSNTTKKKLGPHWTDYVTSEMDDEAFYKAIPDKNPNHMKRKELVELGNAWGFVYDRKAHTFDTYEEGNLVDSLTVDRFKAVMHELYLQYEQISAVTDEKDEMKFPSEQDTGKQIEIEIERAERGLQTPA